MDDFIYYTFLLHREEFRASISPSYLLEAPYKNILTAIARGDGKLLNIYKRAKLGEATGNELIGQLIELEILSIERSREAPLKEHPKQKIKKNLRTYRIQPKARFISPFLRFWFGYVEPYYDGLSQGKSEVFINNFRLHCDRSLSLCFEQLSNELLELHFQESDPLISKGSFWDRYSEFDIVAVTKSGKIVVGECKYKGRKICKNELNKLKDKAINSGIIVDIYALFSKNGFSNELTQSNEANLLLFELEDFKLL